MTLNAAASENRFCSGLWRSIEVLVLTLLVGGTSVSVTHASVEIASTTSGPPESSSRTVHARVDAVLATGKITERLQALGALAETLSLSEIPEALKIAEGLKPLREKMVLEYSTLRRWSELAPLPAFDAIAQRPEGREKVETLQFAAVRLAQTQPRVAAAAAIELPPGKSRQSATNAVAATWARSDGKSALQWANGLPEGLRDSALYALRFAWVHADPAAASVDVATLPPSDTKNALIANIAEEWTTRDLHAALAWAQRLPDGPEKQIALSNTARTWADKDPVAAAKFALTLSPPDLEQTAVTSVLTNWATEDPRAAGDWAATQADPGIRQKGIAAVLNFWAVIAPEEAGRWVKNIGPQVVQDAALDDFARTVAPWAPELGLKLIVQLRPDEAGGPTASECARQWLGIDTASARAWITQANLPPGITAQWLGPSARE